jgi:hypothetical protein
LIVRDELGLNDSHGDSFSVSDVTSLSSRAERVRERELKEQIARQLKQLPEPEFVYEVGIPEEQGGDEGEGAEGVEKGSAAWKEEEAAAFEARKSAVLRRGLPRPARNTSFDALNAPSLKPNTADAELVRASALIGEEMVRLLQYDDYTFPDLSGVAAKGVKRVAPVELEQLQDEDLAAARKAVEEEIARSLTEEENGNDMLTPQQFGQLWEEVHKKLMFLPSKGSTGKSGMGVPANKQEVNKILLKLNCVHMIAVFDVVCLFKSMYLKCLV